MAIYGQYAKFLGYFGNTISSHPGSFTLDNYILGTNGVINITPTKKGLTLLDYLLTNGVPSKLTFSELVGYTQYFNLIDKALITLSQVENLQSQVVTTNQYGESIQTFSSAINVTHAEFYKLITNEQLEVGSNYRITDYKSVNFVNGKGSADWYVGYGYCSDDITVYNPIDVYTSDVEPIIVKAITKSEISNEAFSEKYPSDVIEYNPYVNSIGTTLRWWREITNGNELPVLENYMLQDCFDNFSDPITGFDLKWDGTNVYFQMPEGYPVLFGHYLYIYMEFNGGSYYQDGFWSTLKPGITNATYNYSAEYSIPMSRIKVSPDGKKVYLLDLTEADYNNYDLDTLTVNTTLAIATAYGWVNRRNNTTSNINLPYDWRNQMFRRYNVNLSEYDTDMFYNDNYYISVGDYFYIEGNDYAGSYNIYTNGQYIDYKTFQEGMEVFNVTMEGNGGPDYTGIWNDFMGSCENNIFLGDVQNTSFKDITNTNIFLQDCYNNVFGLSTIINVFGDMSDNTFGNYTEQNILGIYDNVEYNNFTKSNYYNNIITGYFGNNTMMESWESNYQYLGGGSYYYFEHNIFGDYFQDNTFFGNFTENKFGNNCYYNVFDNYETYQNTFGHEFQNNYFGGNTYRNTFGNDCTYNDLYYRVNYNTIGDHFRDNEGDGELRHNKLGNHFRNNYWDSTFQQNTFENAQWFNWNSWDFSGANKVYGQYQTYVAQANNGTWSLSYNEWGTGLVYTSVNA